MNKKRAVLLTTSDVTRDALVNQLNEYLDNDIEVIGYTVEHGLEDMVDADIYIVSSDLQYRELVEAGYPFEGKNVIIGKRTVNMENLDQIVEIPDKTEVLFVNDSEESTYDSIKILNELGVNHIKYIPYYPGVELTDIKATIGITPGESGLIPDGIETVIDIGTRIFDFTTIAKILGAFGVINDKGGMFSKNYLQKIIRVAQKLSMSKNRISELRENLKNVIEGLEEGLIAYDQNGKITVFNENLKRILKPRFDEMIGMKLNQVIFNKKLLEYLMDEKRHENMIMTLEGEEVIIHKTQVMWKGVTIATFKARRPDAFAIGINRKKVINKGYIAKYSMDDIVGASRSIIEAKSIAEKLGQRDMTILIEGESGTGKEMFASAIHNISDRKNGPFLAINFSALTDDLIESELFGYEEGAFTGAKKGGKEGFFEQADGGTIFLDEIGDVSLKVQARLLRVLEEKEIMRVGGNKIRPVKVRVIAATNKNLSELVEEKQFREDLYFRLKMGYIQLPTLRQRREDIPLLLNQLLSTSTIENVEISDEVYDKLKEYEWLGNVRELKNTITYMLAVKSGNVVTVNDLPQKSFFKERKPVESKDERIGNEEKYRLDRFESFLLNTIYENPGIGRKLLSELSYAAEVGLTENQIRSRLNKLEREGFIQKRKGRFGTSLTDAGANLINK
ncbi:sigma 54-interacting transcriptional regulator [Anaeromicrobium sediminis]|uniref:Fis family transcriptional regulator n=1 Tax=Anaeromicrobium sediminis TaxID=1478221 RepID=A0A267MP94_9FIRM|nr:sigma 54-interacting transcriptional regulator [Anaeromicrobium sediminis]PAB60718.1 Fis family transcriptional regulator [Anaeromicrobium sediminis]